MRFKQEVLKLLDSTIPFLSPSGQKVVQSTQYLAELIQSPSGVRALNSLSSLRGGIATLDASGKTKNAAVNPYSLFLVFYLLILATDNDSTSKGSLATDTNPLHTLPLSQEDQAFDYQEETELNP